MFVSTPNILFLDEAPARRGKRGQNHPRAKLTDDEVGEIRECLECKRATQTELSRAFGVSQAQISRIKDFKQRRCRA